MSDLVERLTALSEEYRDHDPDVVAFTAEAAAEITRLRDHAAGLALERDGFQEECKRLRADLAAAQEREQRMREALVGLVGRYEEIVMHDEIGRSLDDYNFTRARAALGEPQ